MMCNVMQTEVNTPQRADVTLCILCLFSLLSSLLSVPTTRLCAMPQHMEKVSKEYVLAH